MIIDKDTKWPTEKQLDIVTYAILKSSTTSYKIRHYMLCRYVCWNALK